MSDSDEPAECPVCNEGLGYSHQEDSPVRYYCPACGKWLEELRDE